MVRMRWLATCSLVCWAGLVCGQAACSQDAQTPEQRVAKLLKDLDGEEYEARTKASAALMQVGRAALPILCKLPNASPEVRVRVEEIVQGIVRAETKEKFAGKHGQNFSAALKPILCKKELATYFPGYRFYFVSAIENGPPVSVVFLTPEQELKDYLVKEEQKTIPETTLLKEIKKVGVTVKNRDEAQAFGLLFLMLAYACEEFKVENTDHQNKVRY